MPDDPRYSSGVTGRRPELRVLRGGDPEAPAERSGAGGADDLLLAAINGGAPGAAAALYDRARPAVDRTITRLLGSRDPDYQDVAQVAMIELTRTIRRYRGDCPLDAWIGTITARVVYKHLRRRRLERQTFTAALAGDAIAGPERPGRQLMLRGLAERISAHLESMSPRRAWAFVLHDVHGRDLQEIAAILEISVSAAQTHLSRGRRELHQRVASDRELASALDASDGGLP
jgi:RNA polymerase sigma-70 factor (ECF subfamily)